MNIRLIIVGLVGIVIGCVSKDVNGEWTLVIGYMIGIIMGAVLFLNKEV